MTRLPPNVLGQVERMLPQTERERQMLTAMKYYKALYELDKKFDSPLVQYDAMRIEPANEREAQLQKLVAHFRGKYVGEECVLKDLIYAIATLDDPDTWNSDTAESSYDDYDVYEGLKKLAARLKP